MGIGTDSANFPSDFNLPAVIFLQDYLIPIHPKLIGGPKLDESLVEVAGDDDVIAS